jgi:hypothetical protein
MHESRIMILDYVSDGRLSVSLALTLLQVLAEVESLAFCCVEIPTAASIEIYLN